MRFFREYEETFHNKNYRINNSVANSDIIKTIDFKDLGGLIGQMDSRTVREWYVYHDKRIRLLVDTSKDIETQARQACNLRSSYRTQARELMADKAVRTQLDRDSPNKSFEQLIEDKMKRKGLSRQDAIRDIYETAVKSNKSVNAKFGLE